MGLIVKSSAFFLSRYWFKNIVSIVVENSLEQYIVLSVMVLEVAIILGGQEFVSSLNKISLS